MSQTQILNPVQNQTPKIEIVLIIERSSEGFYNYKTKYVAVKVPPITSKYEETDILDYNISTQYCGVYQERKCGELIEDLVNQGYVIIER